MGGGSWAGEREPDLQACGSLHRALAILEENLPPMRLTWALLRRNISGKYRVDPLLGDPAPFERLKKSRDAVLPDGAYLCLPEEYGGEPPQHLPLLRVDPESRSLWLPEGGYEEGTLAVRCLDSGEEGRWNEPRWDLEAEQLSSSQGEGAPVLVPVGNLFCNLPPLPAGHVERGDLEGRLLEILLEPGRRTVATLWGPAGTGKSLMALSALHRLSRMEEAPYDVVLWITARDMDLLEDGRRRVLRQACRLRDIASLAALLGEREPEDPLDWFGSCLEEGLSGSTLFAFDGFECLDDPAGAFRWIEERVHPPNKVLITSRHRDFQGDYPLRVGGLSPEEAAQLAEEHLYLAGLEDKVDQDCCRRILAECEGHPYLIKTLLGEAALNRKTEPRMMLTREEGTMEEFYGRIYRSLGPDARRAFLLLSSWRVALPEAALEAVSLRSGQEGFDAVSGLEEAIQAGLVESYPSDDGRSRFVGVPLAAGLFGQRILATLPLRHTLEKDKRFAMEFGAGLKEDARRGTPARIDPLVRAVAERLIDASGEGMERDLRVMEKLAQRFPAVYLRLAGLVLERDPGHELLARIRDYLRDCLRWTGGSQRRRAWLALSDCHARLAEYKEEVFARCEASLVPETTNEEISLDANRLNGRFRDLKQSGVSIRWLDEEIRMSIGRVIEEMESRLPALSAAACSRLAWLHLNMGNSRRSLRIAQEGLEKEPGDVHCQSLRDRLERQAGQAERPPVQAF